MSDEKLKAALQRIARNEIEVFDEDIQGNVLVSMDADEMAAIAYAALVENTREELAATMNPTPAAEDVVETVARAIWNRLRDDEDRCDMELEDMGEGHPVWDYARAAIAALQSRPAEPADEEPVAWQRKHPDRGWIDASEDDLPHYRAQGQECRALYARPATPSNPDRLVEAMAILREIKSQSTTVGGWTSDTPYIYPELYARIEAALSAAPAQDGDAPRRCIHGNRIGEPCRDCDKEAREATA
ncbi:hypothetical protein EDF56_101155 [Novosphingobium sp. PhB165]|uniref:hypothetical protein n=1 Tax=Novosphingobium sp. PhB165 TaxID=2485105 RepID=UPI0010E6CC80|nr:hypothetical protein [Novosphingobium sp. PhB165]TCM21491.1 hypothetical protein EDF56_101155 [Novosphingobium sp. PhB165]